MREIRFTDTEGTHWRVMDFYVQPGRGKRRTSLGSEKAEARAFMPDPWSGEKSDVWVYRFDAASTRWHAPEHLQGQLRQSHPATATPFERMQPSPRRAT